MDHTQPQGQQNGRLDGPERAEGLIVDVMAMDHIGKPSELRRVGLSLAVCVVCIYFFGLLVVAAVLGKDLWESQARISAAKTLLAQIQEKQEAYHSKFGSYATAHANPPQEPTVNGVYLEEWDPDVAGWNSLKVEPRGTSQFQFAIGSGKEGASQCRALGAVYEQACVGLPEEGDWYWATAHNGHFIVVTNSARADMLVIDRICEHRSVRIRTLLRQLSCFVSAFD